MCKYLAIPIAILFTSFCLSGCYTPEGDEGSIAQGIVLTPVVITGAVIATPIYLPGYIWDSMKPSVYATPGTSLKDFSNAIDKAEGKFCQYTLYGEGPNMDRFEYIGKKTVYRGRFKGGIATEY